MSSGFPKKGDREKCWLARDNYWKCLDQNPDNKDKCSHLRKPYEQSCSKAWVKHFDKRYDFTKFKDKIEKEGFDPIENK